ncbi:MAG: trypsin-like peptidase domain-containing protein, partial [Gemmatimonadales bacterium]
MKLQCTFLSGEKRDSVVVFDQPFVQFGRHPQCDLRFDAERDLEVSSRHASVTLQGGVYFLRDLGSTNGTWVNGRRLTGDHVVAHEDIVRFGPEGPEIALEVLRDPRPPGAGPSGGEPPTLPMPTPVPYADTPRAPRRTPGTGIVPPPYEEPPGAERRDRSNRTIWGLIALLVVLGGAFVWQSATSARRLHDDRAALLERVDSLSAALSGVSADIATLHSAVNMARTDAERLRTRIAGGTGDAELERLSRELDIASARQQRLVAAASLDAAGIGRNNADAVAIVLVEFPDGKAFTGSGFAIARDGGGGYLLTNRHVVQDSAGQEARRVGVIFNGSRQNFRASVVAVHPAMDLALIRVDVLNGVPVVQRPEPSGSTEAGDPVVVIGYPLGLDLEMGGQWRETGVAPSLVTGITTKVVDRLIQLDGYGAQGSSGSPVFNA